MKNNHVKGFEQVIIDYAKAKNLMLDQMLSDCQTALLNIAGWICEFYKYSNEEYEKFMREYAANVKEDIEYRFRKE